jgi:hypothetical protein
VGDRLHDGVRPVGGAARSLQTTFDPFRKEADAFRVLVWVVAVVAVIVAIVLIVRAVS